MAFGALGVLAAMRAATSSPRATSSPSAAPEQVPLPTGWRRLPESNVTDALRAFAVEVLRSGAALGELVARGDDVAAFVEWHYDARRGWHRGVSLLTRAPA